MGGDGMLEGWAEEGRAYAGKASRRGGGGGGRPEAEEGREQARRAMDKGVGLGAANTFLKSIENEKNQFFYYAGDPRAGHRARGGRRRSRRLGKERDSDGHSERRAGRRRE